MIFFFFLIISTFIYLSNAVDCATHCNRDNIPSGPIVGVIKSNSVSGIIVVKNDCEFEVQNFSIRSTIENVDWVCATSSGSEGVIAVRDVTLNNASTTLSYDVYNTNPDCHVSLLSDCLSIRLVDRNKILEQIPLRGKFKKK